MKSFCLLLRHKSLLFSSSFFLFSLYVCKYWRQDGECPNKGLVDLEMHVDYYADDISSIKNLTQLTIILTADEEACIQMSLLICQTIRPEYLC